MPRPLRERTGARSTLRGHVRGHRRAAVAHAQRDALAAFERDAHAHVRIAGALGERVADQVVGDAVEQRARQPQAGRRRGRLELDPFAAVLARERFPPGPRGDVVLAAFLRAAAASPASRTGAARSAAAGGAAAPAVRRVRASSPPLSRAATEVSTEQRLQQVLDVVRHARAGLVHRLQVARLAQLLLAQLGDVELAEQLAEQVQVPAQRRAEAVARKDGERELARSVVDRMRRARRPARPRAPPARQRTPATDGTRSSAATASARKRSGRASTCSSSASTCSHFSTGRPIENR